MTIYEQLTRAEGKREYVNQVLNAGGLAEWEAKEYTKIEIALAEEIINLKKAIEHYETNYA